MTTECQVPRTERPLRQQGRCQGSLGSRTQEDCEGPGREPHSCPPSRPPLPGRRGAPGITGVPAGPVTLGSPVCPQVPPGTPGIPGLGGRPRPCPTPTRPSGGPPPLTRQLLSSSADRMMVPHFFPGTPLGDKTKHGKAAEDKTPERSGKRGSPQAAELPNTPARTAPREL